MNHNRDEDCTLNDEDVCTGCGVWHGDACLDCSKRGFHADRCNSLFPEDEAQSAIDSLEHATCKGELMAYGIAPEDA